MDRPLPYASAEHQQAHQFLVEEAHLLDTHDHQGWLALLTEDIRYLMPVRVTTAKGAEFDELATMAHLDEDLYSLQKRMERFGTEHAWTEDPPSRIRHLITNIRTFATGTPAELRVESYVLLFRSRGDVRDADLLAAGRDDLLRRGEDGTWRLARRTVHVDESVLRTQNLAVLL